MSDSDSDDSTRSPEFLQINGIPIYFNEDWGTGIGGGLWTTGKIPEYNLLMCTISCVKFFIL